MVESLAVSELGRKLEGERGAVLLDVREPEERAFARIRVADAERDLFIPMRELPERLGWLRERVGEPAAPIVVYCHHGVRSLHAAAWLVQQGFREVHNLVGGIDAYSLEVDPSVRRYV